jgi:prepilin-type N-terminal cleavage/methylation domain-containing protein
MRQQGFTFVELLLAMAISAVVLPLLVSMVMRIGWDSSRNTTLNTATLQVERASRLIKLDTDRAQHSNLVAGAAAVSSLTLDWTDWSDSSNYDTYDAATAKTKRSRVVYALVGTDLKRTEGACSDWNDTTKLCNVAWVDSTASLAASYVITAPQFSLNLAGDTLTAVVTSSPNEAAWPGQQRTYDLVAGLLSAQNPIQ